MNSFVRLFVRGFGKLATLLSKTESRFLSLLKILIYVYPDLDLFFGKKKIIKYYKLNTLDILLKLRRY